jgi:hypothetical protein
MLAARKQFVDVLAQLPDVRGEHRRWPPLVLVDGPDNGLLQIDQLCVVDVALGHPLRALRTF